MPVKTDDQLRQILQKASAESFQPITTKFSQTDLSEAREKLAISNRQIESAGRDFHYRFSTPKISQTDFSENRRKITLDSQRFIAPKISIRERMGDIGRSLQYGFGTTAGMVAKAGRATQSYFSPPQGPGYFSTTVGGDILGMTGLRQPPEGYSGSEYRTLLSEDLQERAIAVSRVPIEAASWLTYPFTAIPAFRAARMVVGHTPLIGPGLGRVGTGMRAVASRMGGIPGIGTGLARWGRAPVAPAAFKSIFAKIGMGSMAVPGGLPVALAIGGALAAEKVIGTTSENIAEMLQVSSYLGKTSWRYRPLGITGKMTPGFNLKERLDIGWKTANTRRQFGLGRQEMANVLQLGTETGWFDQSTTVDKFKTSLTELTGTAKKVATALRTSIENAVVAMKDITQMGAFTPQQITTAATRTGALARWSGFTPGEMGQFGVMGAQMARQVGIPGGWGAAISQKVAADIRLGQIKGTIDPEALARMGGVRGMAQAVTAQNLMFWKSPMGKTTLASMYLPGKKTGGLDVSRLPEMIKGNIPMGQIMGTAMDQIMKGSPYQYLMQQEGLAGKLPPMKELMPALRVAQARAMTELSGEEGDPWAIKWTMASNIARESGRTRPIQKDIDLAVQQYNQVYDYKPGQEKYRATIEDAQTRMSRPAVWMERYPVAFSKAIGTKITIGNQMLLESGGLRNLGDIASLGIVPMAREWRWRHPKMISLPPEYLREPPKEVISKVGMTVAQMKEFYKEKGIPMPRYIREIALDLMPTEEKEIVEEERVQKGYEYALMGSTKRTESKDIAVKTAELTVRGYAQRIDELKKGKRGTKDYQEYNKLQEKNKRSIADLKGATSPERQNDILNDIDENLEKMAKLARIEGPVHYSLMLEAQRTGTINVQAIKDLTFVMETGQSLAGRRKTLKQTGILTKVRTYFQKRNYKDLLLIVDKALIEEKEDIEKAIETGREEEIYEKLKIAGRLVLRTKFKKAIEEGWELVATAKKIGYDIEPGTEAIPTKGYPAGYMQEYKDFLPFMQNLESAIMDQNKYLKHLAEKQGYTG